MSYDRENLEKLYDNIINKKNTSSKREWSKSLSQFLFENKDAFYTVIQPGGNNGDELIYKGLNKKLKNLGIKYEEKKYREEYISLKIIKFDKNFKKISINKKTDMIIVHGGGNMNDHWGNGIRLLKHIIGRYDIPIIVAPQTFYFTKTNFPEILKDVKQEVHLFCREYISYSLLKNMQLADNIKIYLSDDTSFFLNKEDFMYINKNNAKRDYVLLGFRNDKESNESLDIRKTLNDIFIDHDIDIVNGGDISLNYPFEDFLKIISNSKIVITDRLHIGILSSILEKPVFLLANSYFKNKAVYDYSINHFPYTIFIE